MASPTKKTTKEVANDKVERMMNGVSVWCSFYRANPHRFCKDYLNIDLKLFQKILLYAMDKADMFYYIAILDVFAGVYVLGT